MSETDIRRGSVPGPSADLIFWKNGPEKAAVDSSPSSWGCGYSPILKRTEASRSTIPNDKKKRKLSALSIVKNAAREYAPIGVAAIGLETVISFSFSSLEGLFLIVSTLVVGTSVYIVDR